LLEIYRPLLILLEIYRPYLYCFKFKYNIDLKVEELSNVFRVK